ncbi:MAG: pyrroline-5-carboxylate reductase [bacterium]|nr:pyrroline-5-carboxylate reductase [bacterium]
MKQPMCAQPTLGFIGAGAMTEALVQGVLAAGWTAPGQIHVTNRSHHGRRAALAARFGVRAHPGKGPVLEACSTIVLAVKPVDMDEVLGEVGPVLRPEHLVISVAAGVTLARLARGLGGHPRLVRAMPNTSCQVRQSATVLAAAPGADKADLEVARAVFSAVGQVLTLPEEAIDAVTGLSGCGPAYVYLMIEALAEAGREVGLPAEVAGSLAAQTVFGASLMALRTGEGPEALRLRVASPGGATLAGLRTLEEAGFAAAVRRAVQSASRRASELGSAPPRRGARVRRHP